MFLHVISAYRQVVLSVAKVTPSKLSVAKQVCKTTATQFSVKTLDRPQYIY
jgi:hypothetical protein